MVMEISYLGKKVFLCEVCGFGYVQQTTARGCEDYCRTHRSWSAAITKKAVLKPL
jgi:hypothetical protein